MLPVVSGDDHRGRLRLDGAGFRLQVRVEDHGAEGQ
jgi:hypothetical protein